MDDNRFDLLTQRLMRDTSRRSILGVLAVAALSGALGRVGVVGAEDANNESDATGANGPGAARCSRLNRKCGKDKRCCGGLACRGRRCHCPAGLKEIDGRCVPPCDSACQASPVCQCFNVADDQTGDAAACVRRSGGSVCSTADLCRINADCGSDELCGKVVCSDGFNRCFKLCENPAAA
jgi:hypothetical protein